MSEFADCFWPSRDGLQLHYRDYGAGRGGENRPPILCLPGLTRNARDFEQLAGHLADEWRIICPDMRGRGDSAYAKDSASYAPKQYAEDLVELFAQAGINRFVAIGTSLGGLLTMILAMAGPERIAAAVLNDIGPEVEASGLARIRDYVGQGRSFPTWMHAARSLEESQADAFPDFRISDWLAKAKRCMAVGDNGRIHFDYDMKIAEPFSRPAGATGANLWRGIEALKGRPVLLLRGEMSDILSVETHRRMAELLPEAEAVTVPRVGHAPTLDEPESMAAIERLLARVR